MLSLILPEGLCCQATSLWWSRERSLGRMLKQSASRETAEVQAKVEDKIMNIRSSLNLDLDLSLVHSLRTIEVLASHHSFSVSCSRTSPARARNESVERIEAHSYRSHEIGTTRKQLAHGIFRSRQRSSLVEA